MATITSGLDRRSVFVQRGQRWVHVAGQREKYSVLVISGHVDILEGNRERALDELLEIVTAVAETVPTELDGPHGVELVLENNLFLLFKDEDPMRVRA